MKTKNFKKIRKDKGWTQDKLAKWLGVDRQAVYRYERGNRIPGPVKRLMEYLEKAVEL